MRLPAAQRRKQSIRRRLMLMFMAVSLVVLLIAAAALLATEAVAFWKTEKERLAALADILAENVAAAVTFSDRKAAEETLAGLRANRSIVSAYLITGSGTIFAGYRGPLLRDAGAEERHAQDILRQASRAGFWAWDGSLEAARPVLLAGQAIGTIVIQSDAEELVARLTQLLLAVGIILAGTLGVAYRLSRRMQQAITGPIVALSEKMAAVTTRQDYAIRAVKEQDDEVGTLIDGFNTMLEQIQKRDADLERSSALLRESNEDLKSFVYSAAHDLRAPLVNIRGFAGELALSLRTVADLCSGSGLTGDDLAAVQTILRRDVPMAVEFIDSSVQRMDIVISALLKLSRIGHRTLSPEPVDLADLMAGLIRSSRHQMDQAGVTVLCGSLPTVMADRAAVEQILSNLLDNAVKYRNPARSGRVEVFAEHRGAETLVTVRDNGRGIAADDMPKLFKLFRRLGTQDVPGEGMGLAYVKALVRRHGGRIWCESEPGTGSAFTFTLPDVPECSAADAAGGKP